VGRASNATEHQERSRGETEVGKSQRQHLALFTFDQHSPHSMSSYRDNYRDAPRGDPRAGRTSTSYHDIADEPSSGSSRRDHNRDSGRYDNRRRDAPDYGKDGGRREEYVSRVDRGGDRRRSRSRSPVRRRDWDDRDGGSDTRDHGRNRGTFADVWVLEGVVADAFLRGRLLAPHAHTAPSPTPPFSLPSSPLCQPFPSSRCPRCSSRP
jgi:hypothetical protein